MRTQAVLVPALLGIAATATVIGAGALIDFDTSPGMPPRPPASWPKESKIARARNRQQIVVIAHPECACTSSTLEQLSLVSGTSLSVLFFRPGSDSGWTKGRAWQQVARLEGALALWDDGGKEAKLFESSTSGTVLLYGANGELLFHGGITSSRGHTGENFGLDHLRLAIRTGAPSPASSPVFGCSLLSSQVRS